MIPSSTARLRAYFRTGNSRPPDVSLPPLGFSGRLLRGTPTPSPFSWAAVLPSATKMPEDSLHSTSPQQAGTTRPPSASSR